MSKVYQKLGLFGKTYWHDDGLFVKKITKAKYDEIVIRSQVAQEMARQARTARRVAQHKQAVVEINRRQWADISTEQLVEKADELQVRMDELGNAPLYTPQQRHIDAMRAEINRRRQD